MKSKSLSFILIALLSLMLLGCNTNTSFNTNEDHYITIEYYVLNGESPAKSVMVEYTEDDTLVELIQENFDNVVLGEGGLSGMILEIEGFVTDTTTWSTFISLYINGTMSNYGPCAIVGKLSSDPLESISQCVIENHAVYQLKVVEYSY